jgi:hypothetical protein
MASTGLKNVTVTLDEETLAAARRQAAERGMSVSRYVGEVLRQHAGKGDPYVEAYRAWRAEKPLQLKGPPEKYPKREELYDRPVLRRR